MPRTASSLKKQTDDLENKISFKNVRLLGGLESKLNEHTVFPYFAVDYKAAKDWYTTTKQLKVFQVITRKVSFPFKQHLQNSQFFGKLKIISLLYKGTWFWFLSVIVSVWWQDAHMLVQKELANNDKFTKNL